MNNESEISKLFTLVSCEFLSVDVSIVELVPVFAGIARVVLFFPIILDCRINGL